jgi:hypothetical protein
VLASNPVPVYVLEWTGADELVPRYGSARDTWLPTPDVLRDVAQEARRTGETALRDGFATDGRPLRLAASPVWNGDAITATVVAGGDPAQGQADHDVLARWLALGCLLLVLLAAAAGHALSGRSMRPALRAGEQIGHEPLRLDLLVEQIVADWDAGGVEVSVMASPCVVPGDPDLLTQAVRNLLDNAVRHGGRTPVEVVVGEGVLTVRDHGPGIAPEDRERMFERPVKGPGGSGLAVVRRIATLHGGTARLLDAGDGAVAELALPPAAG